MSTLRMSVVCLIVLGLSLAHSLTAAQDVAGQIESERTRTVIRMIESQGVSVTTDGRAAVQRFLQPSERKDVSSDVLEKVAQAIGDERHFSETAGKTVVDASSVESARAKICPIYPVC